MKKLNYLIVLLLSMIILVPSVNALPTFKVDETLNIQEDYNDTSFFAANNINLETYINGLNFAAGNTINAKGKSDYAFIAGNSITINDYESKDLFIAGNSININNAKARSLYIAGATLNINSSFESIYASGDNVTLTGEYNNVTIAAEKVKIDGSIKGTLTINEDAKVELAEGAEIANTIKYESKTQITRENIINGTLAVIIGLIIGKILHFVNILIIGLIFMSIFKKTTEKINKMDSNAGFVFTRFGLGFIALVCMPIACILLLITGILTNLGIIGILAYIVAIMLTEMFANIYLTTHIFKNMNMYLGYFLMLLITTLLGIIPIVGWILKLFILCFGLGLIMKTIRSQEKEKRK
jgi:cytoskeletal protein CcmA (bactofilin family)